ncbi:gluconeogenesis factor YvcK family protein [Caldisalinibacter kiritimatiensis]|uniref:Putative gluconeogenesis factor n=1 Tax=Caldisalinibacter kiritimatiensis TaxID=1304284 RepID=R1ATH4_9FIRM|nr:YvcK family protein [Caldisalinibacter kiritimatiensis]EOD00418.1 2-phospho-L-lactate transferase [Caldisalinibacter kiritimatiensis]
MALYKWLKPGLGLKRWIVLGIFGLILFSYGVSPVFSQEVEFGDNLFMYIIGLIIGLILIIFSIKNGIGYLLTVVNKCKYEVSIDNKFVNDTLYKKKVLSKGPKIVAIGGGTGLSILLRGLKEYSSNITAIVTVADDGGGSGVLREDLGMLPPGDIRNCILALADTEPIMEKLLQYRFKEGKLKGQSFGNLFLAAMDGICGNFESAVKEMSNVLAVTGKVLPMTLEDVTLYAKLENDKVIKGESNIPIVNKDTGSKIERVFIKPEKSYPLKEAVEAIKEADVIVLGPGSLYTSVIPNLLVKDIVKYIDDSDALKIYISNVMTQPGETDDYSVLDHVNAILRHTKKNILDYVITNNEDIPKSTLEKYYEDGAKPVTLSLEDEEALKNMNIGVIKDKLVDIKKDYIRHDALRLSEIIVDLVVNKSKPKYK